MAFLTPDRIETVRVGDETLTIKQKITPDGAVATRDLGPTVKKGDLVKPNAKLNRGTGIPRGITVHNTEFVPPEPGTNPAEQYARYTYPNQEMGEVAVHYWVWRDQIWQQLRDDEQGWHAGDDERRRTDHRGRQTGGNLDTISIEAIGDDPETTRTAAMLTAYLAAKYHLDPFADVYTHNYWMYGTDRYVPGAPKNCPIYLLPVWPEFLRTVQGYYDAIRASEQ